MGFRDYSATPADNETIGDGIFIGPDMERAKVRPALQQLAADGKALTDELDDLSTQLAGDLVLTLADDGSIFSSRALLSAVTTQVSGQGAFLTESGRSGFFKWSAADLSAQVTADPQQGIYVPPASDTDGSSGAWVRVVPDGKANVDWFGANRLGLADCAAAFNAASASGLTVYVPDDGYYLVNSALTQLAVGQKVEGNGTIRFTANGRCFSVNASSRISGIKIVGDGKAAGKAFQTGVFCYAVTGWHLDKLEITDIAGPGQENGGGAVCVVGLAVGASEGGRISGCRIYNNNGGLCFEDRGEYVDVTGCTAAGNTTGVYAAAGNLSFSSCNIYNNTTGVKQRAGGSGNGGHGTFNGCQINHNTTNLDVDGLPLGMTYSGCELYLGNIILKDSTGLKFIGCDLVGGASNTLTLTGTVANTLISSCRFPLAPNASALAQTLNGNVLTTANNLDF